MPSHGLRDAFRGTVKNAPYSAFTAQSIFSQAMAAYRQQDLEDLKVLFRTIGITTAEGAVEITYAALGGADNDYASVLDDRDEYLLRARGILAAVEHADEPGPGVPGC